MPVPCCHLLSLVVTDIENVMHAYFGMTWCTHGRKEKRQCLRQPGQARMLTLQALLRSALLSGNCRNSAVILKLASVLLESQESILKAKGIRVGAGTRSIAATLTVCTVISQSMNNPTMHAITARMNQFQTQQRRSCRRRQVQSHAQVESVMDVTERRHDSSGLGESL